jgi:hypothetical protein
MQKNKGSLFARSGLQPSATPLVMRRESAIPTGAPPVYRPATSGSQVLPKSATTAGAPPVYRPATAGSQLLPKSANTAGAPPPYRPAALGSQVLRKPVTLPRGVSPNCHPAVAIRPKAATARVGIFRQTGAIIQAVVEPQKLNIVGENHTESSKRRDAEREHASGMHLDYWEENTFVVKKSSVFGLFKSEYYGDSRDLKAEQALTILQDQLKRLFLIKGDAEPLRNDQAKYVFAAARAANQLCGRAEDRRLNDISRVLLGDVERLALSLTQPTAHPEVPLGALQKVAEYLNEVLAGKSIQSVREARSQKMLRAAGEAVRGGQFGVWKVGQLHVDDIRKLIISGRDLPANVTLTDQGEYNLLLSDRHSSKASTTPPPAATTSTEIGLLPSFGATP